MLIGMGLMKLGVFLVSALKRTTSLTMTLVGLRRWLAADGL